MNKFRLGVVTGMSSLIVALPFVAQVSNAQSTGSTTGTAVIPTQACVEAMANVENIRLGQFDAMNAKRKENMQKRVSVLQAASQIADDTARTDALKQIREDRKTERDAANDGVPTEIQTAMDAVKTACGNTFMMGFGGGMGEHGARGDKMGRIPSFIAEKLGMTQDELKAALDSGKTVKDLATEKGIELPAPPARGIHMKFFNRQEIDQ